MRPVSEGVCECVCVWVRERERERLRVSGERSGAERWETGAELRRGGRDLEDSAWLAAVAVQTCLVRCSRAGPRGLPCRAPAWLTPVVAVARRTARAQHGHTCVAMAAVQPASLRLRWAAVTRCAAAAMLADHWEEAHGSPQLNKDSESTRSSVRVVSANASAVSNGTASCASHGSASGTAVQLHKLKKKKK